MLANPQQIREITCSERHPLIQTDDLCQLYEGQSYTANVYSCDTCRNQYNTKSSPASHCKTCGFDLCPNCYEAQKIIQIDCPKNQSHTLLKVRGLQEFSNYASNDYGCQSCGGVFDSSIFPSAHCRACGYDLCPDCFGHIQLHILDPQQSQINFQPPQINIEQSQPQSQPQTISHAPEQPIRWLNSIFTRFVACPNGHALLREYELKRMGFPSGAPQSYICRICNATGLLAVQDKYSCKTCSFDICPHCFNEQKRVEKMLCPNSHGLMIVRTLKEFANYPSNSYRCASCPAILDSIRHPAAHCSTCNYDLCLNCVLKNKPQEITNNGTLQQVTCPSKHNLSPVNNLAQVYPDSRGIYVYDMYNCDTCRVDYNCQVDPSHHCPTCEFDICPSCYQKAQKISFQCDRNHHLYIVSNLKANHEASGSYVDNTYVCQTCQGSWDAAFHPSCHCAQCKFDLCPACFEARNIPSLSQNGGGIIQNLVNKQPEPTICLFPRGGQNSQFPQQQNQPGNGLFITSSQAQPGIGCIRDGHQQQAQPRFDLFPKIPLQQGQQTSIQFPQQQSQPGIGLLTQGQQTSCQLPQQQAQPRFDLFPKIPLQQGQQNTNPLPQQPTQPRLDFFTGKPQGQIPLPKLGEIQTQPRLDFLTNKPLQQGQQNSCQQQAQPKFDLFPKMPLQQGQQNTNQFPQQQSQPGIGLLTQGQQTRCQLPQQQAQPRLDFFTGMPLGQVPLQKLEETQTQPRLDFFTGLPRGQILFPKPEESKINQPEPGKKELSEEILCVVCLNDKRSYLFNPCNHLCACEKCAIDLRNKNLGCPICRNRIQSFTKVYMS